MSRVGEGSSPQTANCWPRSVLGPHPLPRRAARSVHGETKGALGSQAGGSFLRAAALSSRPPPGLRRPAPQGAAGSALCVWGGQVEGRVPPVGICAPAAGGAEWTHTNAHTHTSCSNFLASLLGPSGQGPGRCAGSGPFLRDVRCGGSTQREREKERKRQRQMARARGGETAS